MLLDAGSSSVSYYKIGDTMGEVRMVTDMHQRKAEMAIHFLIHNAEQRHPPADVDQSSMLKGKVLEGKSVVDESMLTGESLPVFKEKGLSVSSGTINWDHPLRVEASSTGSNSTISKIVHMVETKLGSRIKAPRKMSFARIESIGLDPPCFGLSLPHR